MQGLLPVSEQYVDQLLNRTTMPRLTRCASSLASQFEAAYLMSSPMVGVVTKTRGPQLRGRELPLQPDGNFGAGRCGKDVPGLGLAMPQTDRLREGIVRVNLDRQRFLGEQQLEEQG
jgi:hypothetical protein